MKRTWWGRRWRRFAATTAALVVVTVLAFLTLVPVASLDDPYSLVMLDRDGELLGALIAADEQWRFPPRDSVPERLETAIRTFEDKRFRSHPGVDVLAVARATRDNLSSGRTVSGASTITMQVVRLSRKGRPRTMSEKVIEALMALRLELSTSKDEILATYVGHAPYGGNVVGLEAAAWRYLGRTVEELSWADAALLAVLPNSPGLMHPGRNRDALLARRDRLLATLADAGNMDEGTYRLALLEPLPNAPHPLPQLAPHLLVSLERMPDTGVGPGQADDGAGRRVTTSIDRTLQIRATEAAVRHRRRMEANRVHNAAAVIMDVTTGEVLAYVGNAADPKASQHSPHVDCARARRSAGSTLKPLLFAAMLQEGDVLPSQIVADVPLRIGGFAPENFDRTYTGAMPARDALARSLNVPAVRLLAEYGVDGFAALLRDVGLRTLDRPASDYGLSLILGGGEVTLWDLTGVYAGLARAAAGRNPAFFPPRVLPALGQAPAEQLDGGLVIPAHAGIQPLEARAPRDDATSVQPAARLPRSPRPESRQLIDPGAAHLTLEALLEVERPSANAAWRRFASARQIAWKTGTSWGHRDAWAVGVSDGYAVGVWVGNAGGAGRPGLTGATAAAPLLMELFGLLPAEETRAPVPWRRLTTARVCAHSGMLAGPSCGDVREETVPHASARSSPCSYCRVIHCDAGCRARVHAGCESPSSMQAVSRFVLPPAMEWFHARANPLYRPLPPWRADCRATGAGSGPSPLSMVHPRPGGIIHVPRDLGGSVGRVVFTAAHREPDATIHWHLGGEYLGSTRDPHQMELAPPPGEHVLTLVDEDGEAVSHGFRVAG